MITFVTSQRGIVQKSDEGQMWISLLDPVQKMKSIKKWIFLILEGTVCKI